MKLRKHEYGDCNFIGKKVEFLRKERKIKQKDFIAKLQLAGCDITRSAIAKIEVGQRHIYPDEIMLIKEVLNTEFDDIFYGK